MLVFSKSPPCSPPISSLLAYKHSQHKWNMGLFSHLKGEMVSRHSLSYSIKKKTQLICLSEVVSESKHDVLICFYLRWVIPASLASDDCCITLLCLLSADWNWQEDRSLCQETVLKEHDRILQSIRFVFCYYRCPHRVIWTGTPFFYLSISFMFITASLLFIVFSCVIRS